MYMTCARHCVTNTIHKELRVTSLVTCHNSTDIDTSHQTCLTL